MTRGRKITDEEKAPLLAKIRELNAEGLYDPEIGQIVGLPKDKIGALRRQAGIPAVPPPVSTRIRKNGPTWAPCPSCGLAVDIPGNRYKTHQRHERRVIRGVVHLVPAGRCAGSAQRYVRPEVNA